jgi:hydroxymethylpyrimidine pyrophosphatase-like HAD family hydrolase
LRDAGGTLILVTGRELPQLKQVFPDLDLCHMVVAENGALLYPPESGKERPLCDPPEESFVRALKVRGVNPLSVGRVIVATYEPHETTVLHGIKEQGLERQVIFNKGAVMVLPSGVNKASGLACALDELEIDAADVAGVGDAENDHALLQMCGVGAAVGNALQSLKDHADLVLAARHGAGVTQLIERILDGTIDDTPRRPRIRSKREAARVHRLADRHADVHPDA